MISVFLRCLALCAVLLVIGVRSAEAAGVTAEDARENRARHPGGGVLAGCAEAGKNPATGRSAR
ncbi:MAG: hypothetical protein LBI68_06540 [Azoarcus sp.]|nr:hypothetical protein [Azoarcus sp.]